MSESRIPEFVQTHKLSDFVKGLLNEIEARSPYLLADKPSLPNVRFGVVENPAPYLKMVGDNLRIIMEGRFMEVSSDSRDLFKCGPSVMEFRAEMKGRRAAIDYLLGSTPS